MAPRPAAPTFSTAHRTLWVRLGSAAVGSPGREAPDIIADRPDKHAWFLLRKFGPGGRLEAYARIVEMLRRQRPLHDDDAPA